MKITVRTARFLQVLCVLGIIFNAASLSVIYMPERRWLLVAARIVMSALEIYWFCKLENHIYDEQRRKVQDGRTN